MPSAYTHLVFAQEIRNILDDTDIPSLPMYWIGAQGPDVFFFSHMGVMPGTLHKYGNLMHSKKVPETFSFLISHCMKDDELRSYLYGFMTHYGLDCRAHELIVSAAKLEHEKTGYPQGPIHVRMESEIDAWTLNRTGRSSMTEIFSAMVLSPEQKEKLASLFSLLLKEVYQLDVPANKIAGALTEMHLWAKVTRPHPVGEKSMIGGEFFIASPKSTYRLIRQNTTDWPILNNDHKAYPCWYDPAKTISSSLSELYGQGKAIALDMIQNHHMDIRYTFMGRPLSTAQAIQQPHDKPAESIFITL